MVAITEWKGDNVTEFYTGEHGTLTETGLYRQYADNPNNAAGVIDLRQRTWDGPFGLFVAEGGSIGRMPQPPRLPLDLRCGSSTGYEAATNSGPSHSAICS